MRLGFAMGEGAVLLPESSSQWAQHLTVHQCDIHGMPWVFFRKMTKQEGRYRKRRGCGRLSMQKGGLSEHRTVGCWGRVVEGSERTRLAEWCAYTVDVLCLSPQWRKSFWKSPQICFLLWLQDFWTCFYKICCGSERRGAHPSQSVVPNGMPSYSAYSWFCLTTCAPGCLESPLSFALVWG